VGYGVDTAMETKPVYKAIPHLVLAIGLVFAVPAQAHSELASSIPASGSTVTEPKTITLRFTRELRLVTLKLIGGKSDEALAVDRSAPAGKLFSVPLPAIAPGSYEVKWRAAATDGHFMRGSFSFTVAASNNGQPGKS